MTQNITNNNAVQSDDEQEILPLLLLLWSKKIYIGSIAIAGLILGALIAIQKTPQYKADALVQLEPKNGGISLSEDIEDLMSTDSEISAEVEIIKSRMVIGKTVENLNLDTRVSANTIPFIGNIVSFLGVERPSWGWLSHYAWAGDDVKLNTLEVPSHWIGESMTLKVDSPVSYSVSLPDGTSVSGRVGQLLFDETSGVAINVTNLTATEGVEFQITKASTLGTIAQIRSALGVSEKGRGSNLLSITMTHPDKQLSQLIVEDIVNTYVTQNLQRSSEQAEKSLDFLQSQVPVVLQELTAAEERLNNYRLQNESINLDLEATAILEQIVALDSTLNELAIEESELNRLYTKDHPRYVALNNKRRQITLRKDSLESTVQSFPAVQQEVLSRTRDVEVNQQIYLQLLSRQQELSVVKASVVGNVRVIDSALVAPLPVSPNRPQIALIGAFLGLLVGAGIVLTRFFLTKSVDSPEEITELGLAVYSTVPAYNGRGGTDRVDGHIVSRDNPAELAVEALRSLRTSLHFEMLQSGKGLVSVTGPAPSVGKTFVSTNLAYLAAEAGAKVLLIDADMRRGTVGKVMGLNKAHQGLSEFLVGSASLEQVIQSVPVGGVSFAGAEQFVTPGLEVSAKAREPELEAVLDGISLLDAHGDSAPQPRNDDHGSLSVITRGSAPHNPAELLLQDKVPAFLDQVKEQFDLVIVDTPPVLAATDPMIIGRYASTNLMVVRHNTTSLHEIKEVKRLYDINNLDFSGVILNCYDQKSGKYGQYGYTYGYQYNYESSD